MKNIDENRLKIWETSHCASLMTDKKQKEERQINAFNEP